MYALADTGHWPDPDWPVRAPWEKGSAERSPLEPKNKTSYPRIQQLCNRGKFFKFSIHFPPPGKGAVGISGGSRVRGQMTR